MVGRTSDKFLEKKKLKSFLPTPALGIYCFADHEIGYFLSGFDLAIILLCCLFFLRLIPRWKLNYLLCSSGVQRRSEEEVGGGSKEKVRGCCSYEEPLFRPQTHALIQRDKHRQRQRQTQTKTRALKFLILEPQFHKIDTRGILFEKGKKGRSTKSFKFVVGLQASYWRGNLWQYYGKNWPRS